MWFNWLSTSQATASSSSLMMTIRRALLAPSRVGLAIGFLGTLAVGLALRYRFPDLAGTDTFAYWIVDPADPYSSPTFPERGTFLYSPAMALIMAPLGALPWAVVAWLWLAAQAAVLSWSLGAMSVMVAMSIVVAPDLLYGNVAIFILAISAFGSRWPALWALPILAKGTPVVGLVWFLARGEYRKLAIAVFTTVALVAVSLVYAPTAWLDWIGVLASAAAVPDASFAPLWVRWPLAAVLTAWAARTDRPWLVPIAVAVSFGHGWLSTYTVALGAVTVARPALLEVVAPGSTTA